jgi:hypothetical protein
MALGWPFADQPLPALNHLATEQSSDKSCTWNLLVPDIRRFQHADVVLNMSYLWVQRVEGGYLGKGLYLAIWTAGKGAVDSQHETGVEGSLHPCAKG